jgi:arylsulfatase A-like enzyme
LPRILLPLVGKKFHTPDFERIFYTDSEMARVQELYDQALRRVDRCLGQLLELIRQSSRGGDAVVMFSADHGEGLDRRFERAGHGRLYDNGIRIPLVIEASSISARGQVVEDLVTTLDIAPTICELASADVPQQFQGRSLRAAISGQPRLHVSSRVISEYHDSRAVRTSDWKLIHRGHGIAGARTAYGTAVELYHLAHDPGEDFNVADVHPVLRDRLLDELREFEAAVDESSLVPATFQRDNLTLDRLRGLGYIE